MPQPIIGIGHSIGAVQLTHLALIHPRLFQAFTLIEPMMQLENPGNGFAATSTYRRDLWPSRRDAEEKFKSSKFFKTWDSRALRKYIEYGLRDLPTELYPESRSDGERPVTLTTTKAQEVFSYLRPAYECEKWPEIDSGMVDETHPEDREDFPFHRPELRQLFRRLSELKPAVLYIFGENSEFSTLTKRREKMEMTGVGIGGSGGAVKGRVKQAVLLGGHLVPVELVTECAESIASYICSELSRWNTQRENFKVQGSKISRRERIEIDEQWKENVEKLSRRPKGRRVTRFFGSPAKI